MGIESGCSAISPSSDSPGNDTALYNSVVRLRPILASLPKPHLYDGQEDIAINLGLTHPVISPVLSMASGVFDMEQTRKSPRLTWADVVQAKLSLVQL